MDLVLGRAPSRALRWLLAISGSALLVLAVLAAPALAHQDPPGCTTGAFNPSFDPASGLGVVHRNGDLLEIRVSVRNDAPSACTYSDVTVQVEVPEPDGSLGPPVTLITGATYPGGTPPTMLSATVPYEVDLEPGVFSAPVKVSYSGVLHTGAIDAPPLGGSLSTPLVTSKPHVTVSVTPDPLSGPAPFSVSYIYAVTNDTPVNPNGAQGPTPALAAPTGDTGILADDSCEPLVFTGGDTTVTVPPLLEEGETWTFSCSRVFADPGTFVNTATILGSSTRDGRPWPATTGQGSVTALGPDLTVAKSHSGDFVRGQTARAYTVTVRNAGNQPTSGTVTVKDSLPAGLTATAIAGEGWTCERAGLTCTRSDALGAGAAYPPVTVTVDVAADAPGEVTNVAAVSGGGQTTTGNDTASDRTVIAAPPNRVAFGRATRNRDGSISLRVKVPWAGRVVADDGHSGRKTAATKLRPVPNLLKPAVAQVAAPGTVVLKLRPTRTAKRRLQSKPVLKVRVEVKFDPTGGEASVSPTRIKLKPAAPRRARG